MDPALWQLWWIWAAAALVLAMLEMVVPGFIFIGFACGAALVALLVLLPVDPGLTALLAIFAGLSLLAWIVLRRLFRKKDDQTRVIHEDINK
jgi:membrane protein implicated in regulation of membrane protease activity